MSFQPEVNARIHINGKTYLIGAHPQAPGVPYGQEGRQGNVYLLHSEDKREKKAIKVFRSKFVNPSMVFQTQQLAKFKGMAGLWACERYVVTPQNNENLLSAEPDLLYSVVMPWVDGPTWMDVLLAKQCLTKKESFSAAFAFAHTLTDMEQRGLAHCDLSAPNLILPMLNDKLRDVKPIDYVQLIDLEQMYSTQLEKPEYIPAGSPGYASQSSTPTLMWSAHSDRFSGAVLLMEMLGASTASFMENVWGESYFSPAEMQSNCERYKDLLHNIRKLWGDAMASLFVRAWESEVLTQCPTFAEWLMELSKIESTVMNEHRTATLVSRQNESRPNPPQERVTSNTNSNNNRNSDASNNVSSNSSSNSDSNGNSNLLQKAKVLESKGKIKEAIEVYRSIYAQNPHSNLAKEIEIAIASLEQSKPSKAKRERAPGTSKIRKIIKVLSLMIVLGLVGLLVYLAFGAADKRETVMSLNAANEKIEGLNKALADSKQTITQLNAKLKEQDKPLAKKREDFLSQLNQDYYAIIDIANSESATDEEKHRKTFEASGIYLNHLFNFMKNSYNLDQQWQDQANIVQGYYYPYIYNDNRNAQLNLQFYSTYLPNFNH